MTDKSTVLPTTLVVLGLAVILAGCGSDSAVSALLAWATGVALILVGSKL